MKPERVNLEGQWKEISLEEWDRETEAWFERERERTIHWAGWAFRLQGFIPGLLLGAALMWLWA